MTTPDRYTARVKRVALAVVRIAIGIAGASVTCGCEKPILSPDEDRSPFDRYDAVRNQHADQYITDEFGRRRPNLRERLMPKQ
jgi:hypothetical protein